MLRFDWDEGKTGAIGQSMEFGLKKLRTFSAIHMRACFLIQNTPWKKIGSSSSE
jgi:hypothetical protein